MDNSDTDVAVWILPEYAFYDYVIMGPDGNSYYVTGEFEPVGTTPFGVPLIPRYEPEESEVIVILDDDEPIVILDDEPEESEVIVILDDDEPPAKRAAAVKCKNLISEFFFTLELYGEEF